MNNDELAGVIARHRNARPNPAENPAWANCEHDMGFLIEAIAALQAELEARCGALHKAADAMWCAVDSFQQVMDVQVIQDHGYQGEWNAMSDALHEYRAALTREAK